MVFDDILNDCLERMAAGEDIERCAGRYPEHADELLPLLRVAAATAQAAASVSYRPEAKARGLARLNQALADRGVGNRWRIPFLWPPIAKPVVVGFVGVLLTVVAAGGTTMASSDSVPGDPLYWVKTTKENISLKLPQSDMGKARAHARLAGERGEEMRRLVETGRLQEAERLSTRMRRHLDHSAQLAGVVIPVNYIEMPVRPASPQRTATTLKFRTGLERDGIALRSGLLQLVELAPPAQKPRLRRLMLRSQLGYLILIEALDEDKPPARHFWIVQPSSPRRR